MRFDLLRNQLNKALVKASLGDKESFDDQMTARESPIDAGNYDLVKGSLEASTDLFDRMYDDTERRSLAETKIKTSWGAVPAFVRIEILIDLAESALGHSDQNKALELVNEGKVIMDTHQWPLEVRIPMSARLAGLRFRSGDRRRARSDADALRSLYAAEGNAIVNIYRARALLPLAQAYQSMGESDTALGVYKQAVEEGIDNPNSRPCAEDLSATCCSMALCALEPDAELWTRLHQIHDGLRPPW